MRAEYKSQKHDPVTEDQMRVMFTSVDIETIGGFSSFSFPFSGFPSLGRSKESCRTLRGIYQLQ